MNDARAILLTGVFGAGKSAVAEEIADLLEASTPIYAAIDLDWLCWSNARGADHGDHMILARNLAAVAETYRQAGVERFVLAGSMADIAALQAVRAALAVPVIVVRLTAPLAIIEERLGSSPTRGRADDLARAREWMASGIGVGLEDEVIENVGSIRDTAVRVLELAGWVLAEPSLLRQRLAGERISTE